MEWFIIFNIKFSIAFSIFTIFYYILLRKETFFSINRTYLIFSVFSSLIISILNIEFNKAKLPIYDLSYQLNPIIVTSTAQANSGSILLNLTPKEIIVLIYSLISISIFVIFILSNIQLFYRLRNSKVIKLPDKKFKVIISEKFEIPFSFFDKIIIPINLMRTEGYEHIITHEITHLNKKHYLDLFLRIFVFSFFWYNPFVYLWSIFLNEVHEFQADEETLKKGIQKYKYMQLIANSINGAQLIGLSNQFNKSSILMRFKMMNKNKSKQLSKWKYLLTIPIFAILFLFISCNIENNSVNPVDTVPLTKLSVRPEPIGGYQVLTDYLMKNNQLTNEAIQNKVQTAYIVVSYNVYEDGSINDVQIVKGALVPSGVTGKKVGYNLDEKAVDIVKGLPKYKPGELDGKKVKVNFQIPILLGSRQVWEKYKTPSMLGRSDEVGEYAVWLPRGNNENNSKLVPATIDSRAASIIVKNMKYPEEARKNGKEGIVNVSFNVSRDGKPINITLRSTAGYGMDEEAIRVVKLLDSLELPKDGNGNFIENYTFTLPIKFKLNDGKPMNYYLNDNEKKLSEISSLATYNGNLMEFLGKNLKYPENAIKKGIDGTVIVRFDVETNGKLTNVRIEKGVDNDLDAEALRVVKLIKEFIPAKDKNGIAIKTENSIPIKFRLR